MEYKTILVHAAPEAEARGRIRLAARLAREHDAHLIGSAPTGVSRFMPCDTRAALAGPCATLRDAARRALERFDLLAADEGVGSYETRLADDEAGAALALDARYCDLAIVGRASRGITPLRPDDLAQHLILTSGRPVLVVPMADPFAALEGGALVAWDGSVQATRAVDGALPLLRAARNVTVLAFAAGTGCHDDEACARLASFLRRHDIHSRARIRPCATDLGAAMLAEASERGARLLVMGAYGHPQWHELLLHGVSATILRRAHLPVLLAH